MCRCVPLPSSILKLVKLCNLRIEHSAIQRSGTLKRANHSVDGGAHTSGHRRLVHALSVSRRVFAYSTARKFAVGLWGSAQRRPPQLREQKCSLIRTYLDRSFAWL